MRGEQRGGRRRVLTGEGGGGGDRGGGTGKGWAGQLGLCSGLQGGTHESTAWLICGSEIERRERGGPRWAKFSPRDPPSLACSRPACLSSLTDCLVPTPTPSVDTVEAYRPPTPSLAAPACSHAPRSWSHVSPSTLPSPPPHRPRCTAPQPSPAHPDRARLEYNRAPLPMTRTCLLSVDLQDEPELVGRPAVGLPSILAPGRSLLLCFNAVVHGETQESRAGSAKSAAAIPLARRHRSHCLEQERLWRDCHLRLVMRPPKRIYSNQAATRTTARLTIRSGRSSVEASTARPLSAPC